LDIHRKDLSFLLHGKLRSFALMLKAHLGDTDRLCSIHHFFDGASKAPWMAGCRTNALDDRHWYYMDVSWGVFVKNVVKVSSNLLAAFAAAVVGGMDFDTFYQFAQHGRGQFRDLRVFPHLREETAQVKRLLFLRGDNAPPTFRFRRLGRSAPVHSPVTT
jgi:hypothetical protein